MSDAVAAATLVLFRDRGDGPPDLLIVERSRAMAFAGGALVFPGGRVDPGDEALAALTPDAPDDASARIAAVRETIEETGVAIGLVPPPASEVLAEIRARLHAGEAFAGALAATGLTLDLSALIPFARWRPTHAPARIFDTRFYLARLPNGAPEPAVDGTENTRLFWSGAQAVLDEAAAGRATVIFPTRRNLERLARFASFDEAVRDAVATPVRTITPVVEDRGGIPHLCIPDDLGYPITSEPVDAVLRG